MKFTKDEILTLYLNRVYFGAGTYGVEAAARRYFNKGARDVSLKESAILAGLLKAPSRLAPTENAEAAEERSRLVLNAMVEAGYITAAERDGAETARTKVAVTRSSPGADYFADWVLEQVPGFIGTPESDIVIETTLDLSMQRAGLGDVEPEVVGEVAGGADAVRAGAEHEQLLLGIAGRRGRRDRARERDVALSAQSGDGD
jgi:penicillin-binding protein 1A